MCAHARSGALDALEDELVLRVLAALDPLPDRFASAATCRRLRRLAADPRLLMHVSPAGQGSDRSGWRRQWACVRAAVRAARAGETIVLGAGEHCVGDGLAVDRPLRLTRAHGSGAATLVATNGADVVHVSAAAARMDGLELRARGGGACIAWHAAGALRVADCTLRCEPPPLAHLAEAVRCGTRSLGPKRKRTAAGGRSDRERAPAPECHVPTRAPERAHKHGPTNPSSARLELRGTRIVGGPRAVRVGPGGALRNVRTHAGVYAFDVHYARPAVPGGGATARVAA